MLLGVVYASSAAAARLTSPSFQLDTNLGGSFGGALSSPSYKMSTIGAEAVVGNGASGSYRLTQDATLPATPSLQLSLQPSGLANYFPFDENTGTVANDASAMNAQATLSNGPTWTAGKIGSALLFDGVDDTATVPYAEQSLTSGQLTVAGWIKVASTSNTAAYQLITDRRLDSTHVGFSLSVSKANGHFAVSSTFNGTQYTASSSASVVDGAWHYIAYVVDDQNISVYVDGSLQDYTPYTGVLDMPAVDIRIGQGTFNGTIDELKYFNRALSAQDIAAAYTAQKAGVTNALNLGTVTGSTSSSANVDAIVQANTSSYNLAISQDHDLQTASSSGAPADRSESFDAASPGASLTTANTTYDSIAMGSGASSVASASPGPLHGTFATYTSSASSSYAYGRFAYVATNKQYSRFYFRISAYPVGQSAILMQLRDSGQVDMSNVKIGTNGKINLSNLATTVATSAASVTLNQWVRAEVFWNQAANTQTLQLYYGANVDGSVPDETLTGAAGGSNPAVDIVVGDAYVPKTSYAVDIDDTAISTTGWLGSSVAAPSSTIPAITGSIASPTLWNEGVTRGLGFAVVQAPVLDGRWGGGTKYASFPGSATTFYTQPAKTGAIKDVISVNARVAVRGDQAVGTYANTVTVTGTTLP